MSKKHKGEKDKRNNAENFSCSHIPLRSKILILRAVNFDYAVRCFNSVLLSLKLKQTKQKNNSIT